MIEKQLTVKLILVSLFVIALFGTPPTANYLAAQDYVPNSKLGDCAQSMFASREEMVPPYTAITISADDEIVIGVTRPTDESYVVDVTRVSSTESAHIAENIASVFGGEARRIFVFADASSRSSSLVAVLAALEQLGHCNWSIVASQSDDQAN